MGIFAKVCRGNGKNYGWHDMKNPGGSNLQFPSGLFSAPFNFETKNRRSLLNVYFWMILRFAGLSYKI
uniref:Uncharacterized protein n=1 Tax=Myoviridae sp. ctHMa1 TaxID=2827671 RepID=A0A8S5SG40_9CAUD|nr:MAG TPA: hypothetical protein [Myoviridae sp. ctHMa1]